MRVRLLNDWKGHARGLPKSLRRGDVIELTPDQQSVLDHLTRRRYIEIVGNDVPLFERSTAEIEAQ